MAYITLKCSKCYPIINLYGYGSVYTESSHLCNFTNSCYSKEYLFFYRYMFKNSAKVGLQEVGPRFTLKLRSLQHGTFDSTTGEYVWLHNVSVCVQFITGLKILCGYRGNRWTQTEENFTCK